MTRPQWQDPTGKNNPGHRFLAPLEILHPATQTKAEQSSGLDHYEFGFLNLAASVSALQGTRDVAGVQSTISARMPYAGSIIGLGFESNAAKTAGTASFVPYVEGNAQQTSLVWSVANSGDVVTFPPGTYVFDAGDRVDPRVTTSGFAPTTADVLVTIFVSYSS